ncbi:unnamed protein product (macronuclear) [Paramecium tetraurelia]|uniref:Amino acid transporter transmembrane domain-containing protein n=1 Tax=Paramecium tetraurelia TaxID=5888 RepID=A0DV04_PARTE|nr:uncharacterized protein GSPATT00020533001 [Paramecium tetraurelia]CAK86871.1 unnamed protein product [Paramecium tetraurelia]|eukprot:XP_001454268.1 hypothetical protein (macronuclear) [Paramecium tetraurelia strain d4-2]
MSNSQVHFSDMQSTFISNYMEMEEPVQEKEQQLNWCQRTFGPLKKGGIRMSIISLLAPCLGVGMLGLPYRAKDQGLIIELLLIALCGIISCISMHILSWSAGDLQCSSYSELIQMSLGNKMKRGFEILTICQCLLGITQIQISFQLFIYELFRYFEITVDQRELAIITQLIFIIPNLLISFQKTLYKLRYFSLVGVISVIYITSLTSLDYFARGSYNDDIKIKLVDVDFNIFTTFAMTFFCYLCHLFIFPIRKELHNPTISRQSKIWKRQCLICFIVYSLICISGYLRFGDDTQPWVIYNYHGDLFFVGKLGMSMALFFAVPLNILACRQIIHDMLLSDEMEYQLKHRNLRIQAQDGKITFEVDSVDTFRSKIHIYSTLVLQFGSAILALILPNINRYITLLGGLLGTTMVCLIPVLIYLKEYRDKLNYSIVILEIMGVVFGWIGAVYGQF